MSIHPRYIVQDPEQEKDIASSVVVIRTSDSTPFLGTRSVVYTNDDPKAQLLSSAVLPHVGKQLSLILNHPNIISLVDVVNTTTLPDGGPAQGEYGDLTIWEDMNAGCLTYILPPLDKIPSFEDDASWHTLASQNFERFSLPESLCWHVLRSISRALLWLYHGVKEDSALNKWNKHDEDWQPILIRDVSPDQIWFQHPKGPEYYGPCKLGGFQSAVVTGNAGGLMALAPRDERAPRVKKMFWAPEVYDNIQSSSRLSEIWSLGAVIYVMMTGMPPPRTYDYNVQISRMHDKGFGDGIRKIVGKMLEIHPDDRPRPLDLVDQIEYEWRRWRAETREGQEFVDVDDKFL